MYDARKGVHRVLVKKPEGKRPLGINERIISRCILRKWDLKAWTGWIWLRIGTGGGHV
jgi:hypothetical protein